MNSKASEGGRVQDGAGSAGSDPSNPSIGVGGLTFRASITREDALAYMERAMRLLDRVEAGDAGLVEVMARAICQGKGLNPDALYEHSCFDPWPTDVHNEFTDAFTGDLRTQRFHRAWRHSVKLAAPALAAVLEASK